MDAAEAFLEELVAVCRKHDFTLGHVSARPFQVQRGFDQREADWLLDATVREENAEPKRLLSLMR